MIEGGFVERCKNRSALTVSKNYKTSCNIVTQIVACEASVSMGFGSKTEKRDFRCFARAKNGARAKKTKEGVGEGKERTFHPLEPSIPSYSRSFLFLALAPETRENGAENPIPPTSFAPQPTGNACYVHSGVGLDRYTVGLLKRSSYFGW